MRLDRPDEVRAALEHADLVPHPPHVDDDGATMRLRSAMARFTGGAAHAARRAAVVELIDRLDVDDLSEAARAATTARLGGARLDAAELARHVPTEAVAVALGIVVDDRLVDDVHAMVAVIGRGAAPSKRADAATERLLARADAAGLEPVAAMSVLYQNTDATAALLLARLAAIVQAAERAPAVPRTRRVARCDVQIGGHRILADTEVTIEIGAAGLPFGAGRHACPGQTVATRLVDCVADTITDAGYVPEPSSVELDADGRPVAMSLVATTVR